MNEVTYVGACCSLLTYLGGSLARRYPDSQALNSGVIVVIGLMTLGLVALAAH